MKKNLLLIITGLITTLIFTACSPFVSDTSGNNVSSIKQISKILWESSGQLEPQIGYDKNLGTAGMLYGNIGNYVIVGGGANFPNESPAVGGAKKTYPDVYIFEQQDSNLVMIDHISLDYEIGYGSSITTSQGIYYVGGSTDPEHANDVTLFTLDSNNKLTYNIVADLPFTFSDGIASYYDNKIYFGLGKQDGKSSNKFYCLDLSNNQISNLNNIPGENTRNQSISQVLGDYIYVFSGGDSIAYTDGYKFDLKANSWSKVSDVVVDSNPISLLGASSVKLNEDQLLVIGGFDKLIYDNAVKNLNSLQGEELQNFKNTYFSTDPVQFNWNNDILVYTASTDSWKSLGQLTFDAPCGAAIVLLNDKLYSINGETKPGTRTNRIYVGNVIYN